MTLNLIFFTNCDSCIFVDRNEEKQTGCKMRTDVVKIKNELSENKNWQLEGLCQFKRSEGWPFSNSIFEDQQKQIQKEVQLKFDLVIKFTDNFKHDIAYIRSIPYSLSSIKILFSDPDQYVNHIKSDFIGMENEARVFSPIASEGKIIQLRQSKSTYVLFTDDVGNIPLTLFDCLNEQINNKGLRFFTMQNKSTLIISRKFFHQVPFSINDLVELSKEKNQHLNLDEFINNYCLK